MIVVHADSTIIDIKLVAIGSANRFMCCDPPQVEEAICHIPARSSRATGDRGRKHRRSSKPYLDAYPTRSQEDSFQRNVHPAFRTQRTSKYPTDDETSEGTDYTIGQLSRAVGITEIRNALGGTGDDRRHDNGTQHRRGDGKPDGK
jgi:hypothetical protein